MTLIIENLYSTLISEVTPGESFIVRDPVALIHRDLEETRNGIADYFLDITTDPDNPQLSHDPLNLGSAEYTTHLTGAIIADRDGSFGPANLFTVAANAKPGIITITVYKCDIDQRDPSLNRADDPACEKNTAVLEVVAREQSPTPIPPVPPRRRPELEERVSTIEGFLARNFGPEWYKFREPQFHRHAQPSRKEQAWRLWQCGIIREPIVMQATGPKVE